MENFYQTQEDILNDSLVSISDSVIRIDRVITFIISVRSTLDPRVEEWIKETLPLCREKAYEKGLYSLYSHMAFYYLMHSDYPLGKSYLDKAGQLDWSQFVHSREHMYNYHAHGLYYHFTGDSKLAIEYFEKSLELARALRNLDFSCQMLNNIALYHLKNSDFPLAEKALLEAFSLINPSINPIPAIKIMDNLGHLYMHTGEYDRSLDYLNSGLAYANERGIEYMHGALYMSYGLVHEKKQEFDRAEDYLRRAFSLNGDTYFFDDIPLELIRFLFERQKKDEALELAENMRELFSSKGMNGSLEQIYHLLDQYDI